MRHVHTVCKHAPSLFPPFPVLLPIHPLCFYFFNSVPASLVSLSPMLQRSSRNSAVCHHILAVGIKPLHNYVMLKKSAWNKGTEKHEEGECKMRNMHHPRASSMHNTTDTDTQTILLFHSNKGIITAHKWTRTTCQSARCKCPKTNE